ASHPFITNEGCKSREFQNSGTYPLPASSLGNNSVLFDGMYYNWTGYFSPAAGAWSGSVNYAYYAGTTFNVSEVVTLAGTYSYTIDNQTRQTTGGLFGKSSTPYWIFTNVSTSDSVPIAVDGSGDSIFQVTAIQAITYNSAQYQCFVLNNSASWAYYDVNTGILIESYFQFINGGTVYNYTINLAATNAQVNPLSILSPGNITYHYSSIPVVIQNATALASAWCRNSTDGGASWSQNYTLAYNGTVFTNSSILKWTDGYHLLQVFANTLAGTLWAINMGFSVDTYGPWIQIMTPQNATYFGFAPMIQLPIDVQNHTLALAVWFRDEVGGMWSHNFTIPWNGTDFITAWPFSAGPTLLQVFANDSLNHVANQTVWFTYSQGKNSVPFDGLFYSWTGYFSPAGESWSGNVNYTYDSGNTFNVTEGNSLLSEIGSYYPTYSIDNTTRIATGGFWAGYSTPIWIFPNASISDSIPIAIAGIGDVAFQVTAIQLITLGASIYQCFVLNNSASWADYEVTTGVLIAGYFDLTNGAYYTMNLDETNAIPTALTVLAPGAQIYHYSQIPITVQNETSLASAWYRDSTDGGASWSQNSPLAFNGATFSNTSIISWVSGYHLIQVYGETPSGMLSGEVIIFRVNLFAPYLIFGQITPVTGNASTSFTFSVVYCDGDNDPPAFVQAVINGTAFDMQKVNADNSNYASGCLYSYSTTLAPGTINYFFICSDGDYTNQTVIATVQVAQITSTPGNIFLDAILILVVAGVTALVVASYIHFRKLGLFKLPGQESPRFKQWFARVKQWTSEVRARPKDKIRRPAEGKNAPTTSQVKLPQPSTTPAPAATTPSNAAQNINLPPVEARSEIEAARVIPTPVLIPINTVQTKSHETPKSVGPVEKQLDDTHLKKRQAQKVRGKKPKPKGFWGHIPS
ncbi:MAG TPA: hypothetical protein VKK79_21150, partial [Candidatus Lokiarchaeia archaeon]|nr:hypothetical protein [Candidatus Lokiarchaeia archaeon]